MTTDHTTTLQDLARTYGLDAVLCALSRIAAEEPLPRPARVASAPPALPPALRGGTPCNKLGHIVGLPLSGRLVAQNLTTGIALMETGGETIQVHLEWFEEFAVGEHTTKAAKTKKPAKNWLVELLEKSV